MDNKALIQKLSEKLDKPQKDISMLIDGFVEIIKEACSDMDTVAIPGFGNFEPKKRAERVNVHPSTGKKILIPPKVVLNFKMSAVMKQKLRDIQ